MIKLIFLVLIALAALTEKGRAAAFYAYKNYITRSKIPWLIFFGVFIISTVLGHPPGARGTLAGIIVIGLAAIVFWYAPRNEDVKFFLQEYIFDGHDVWAEGYSKWHVIGLSIAGVILIYPAGYFDMITNWATVIGLLVWYLKKNSKKSDEVNASSTDEKLPEEV